MIERLQAYSTYRDSGLAWAGPIPSHWKLERGKGLFQKMSRPVREEDEVVTCFRDGMVTLRRNRRLRGYTEATVEHGYQGIRRGDLVIHAMDAFAGAVGVSDSDGKGSPVYSVCRPRQRDSARYFAHIVGVMARTNWILALAKGIRERSTDFRFEAFACQQLPVPPQPEQVAIVRFLDHVGRRIERAIRAKRKVIALLQEQKHAIINRFVTQGLSSSRAVRDSGLAWLGVVPAHWGIAALRRHWSVTDCKHLTVPFVDDGVPLASVREVRGFVLDLSRAKRTTQSWGMHLTEGGRQPRRGDIIYCRNVSVGSAAIVDTDIDFAMGQDVCRIRSVSQNQRFLNYFLHSPAMSRQLELLLVGSTFKRVNVSEIKALTVVVPPRGEQDSIVRHLDLCLASFEDAIRMRAKEVDLLQEYRSRLTADVVTGKLDVREAASRLPDEPHYDLSEAVPGSIEDASDEEAIVE